MLLPVFLLSQNTSGVATYQRIIKLDKKSNPKLRELGIELPDELKSRAQLTFRDSISLYKNLPKEIDEVENGNIRINFKAPEHIKYIDRKQKEYIEQNDIFGKYFLINSDYKTMEWDKKPEIKKIGDYYCQMAVLKDTSKQIVAWFTPQIPVNCGPEGYGDLPGLIVLLVYNNGKSTIALEKIEFKEIDDIPKPEKGEKISQEEFIKKRNEKRAMISKRFIIHDEDDDD